MDPALYIFNSKDSIQTAGRIEYSLDSRYIQENIPFDSTTGFYSKLVPQFPQLENERTMEMSKESIKTKTLYELIKSPLEIKGISVQYSTHFGVLFIYLFILTSIFKAN